MNSPQSVTSAFESASTLSDPVKQKMDFLMPTSGYLLTRAEVSREETMSSTVESSIGILDVYIHQARDIHNICIYHKQDVYGKFFITNNPESTVSTQIINGGGRNPVFNETLRLNVAAINTSLKCEIWMLSRVRNYLPDQLLGFALISLSEVLIANGKLEKEFPLSSTNLFHSPAGFVHLSLSYNGVWPELMAIPAPPSSVSANGAKKDLDSPKPIESDFDKIQFPDPQVVNENQMMVSEYFGVPCVDSEICEKLSTPETENNIDRELGARVVESFSKPPVCDVQVPQQDSSPPSSVSNYESPSMSLPSSFHSCETPKALKSPDQEQISHLKDSCGEAEDGQNNSSVAAAIEPLLSANTNTDVEQKVVQQEIVDIYLKSMQQFTQSLAKMKLPIDIEHTPTNARNSLSTDKKSQGSKTNGARVFYGSRAFF